MVPRDNKYTWMDGVVVVVGKYYVKYTELL